MIYLRVYKSKIGNLLIKADEEAVVEIDLLNSTKNLYIQEKSNDIIELAISQLDEYFNKKRKIFTFPIKFLNGTDFQWRVWKELQNIKYGCVATYGEVAKNINNPKACRAVGNACNKNHLLLVVPCHRVVAANNKIGGFACGEKVKKYLLGIEKCNL